MAFTKIAKHAFKPKRTAAAPMVRLSRDGAALAFNKPAMQAYFPEHLRAAVVYFDAAAGKVGLAVGQRGQDPDARAVSVQTTGGGNMASGLARTDGLKTNKSSQHPLIYDPASGFLVFDISSRLAK